MFNSKVLYIGFVSALFFAAGCSENSASNEKEPISQISVQTVENLHAPFDRSNPDASPYVYFNLRTGETVDTVQADTDNWDIAFRGTSVIINSGTSGPGQAGAVFVDIEFDNVEIAPTEGYNVDSNDNPAITGSDGWYTYTGNDNPPHAVISNEDKTIILKTADGNHFAKLHIMSYYKDSPDYDTEEFANFQTRPPSQYYTFRYAIQMTENLRDLK